MIETSPGRVVVRAAEEGDWEAVMALIVELAAYEEAQAEVREVQAQAEREVRMALEESRKFKTWETGTSRIQGYGQIRG